VIDRFYRIGSQRVKYNRRFRFQKRRQLFSRVHSETLSVVAVRVCNPDRSPAGIHG
jgi:hypothetical protein